MAELVETPPKNDFRDCFEGWKACLEQCAASVEMAVQQTASLIKQFLVTSVTI